MTVYTEVENEFGIYPALIDLKCTRIIEEPLPAWDLPDIDILDIWGSMSLRAAVGLLSGGDTPTTYSRRMAEAMAIIVNPSLLDLSEAPVLADFTQALDVVASLRLDTVDAEVVDAF